MRYPILPGLLLLLILAFSAGCAAQEGGVSRPSGEASSSAPAPVSLPQLPQAQESGEAPEVSPDFAAVAEDFTSRYLALDRDGQQFDKALQAVDGYLQGQLEQGEAESILRESIDLCAAELESAAPVVFGEAFQAQLRSCGISPEEYEAFANSRPADLQSQQTSLNTLLTYLQSAEGSEHARENLRFFQAAHTSIQDSMRGYYYYGCFNYWFTGAGEAELAFLRQTVVPQIAFYLPEDAAWYGSRDEVEEQVMRCLDEVEQVQDGIAQHVGEEQTELYELEQDGEALGESAQELQEAQQELERLLELGRRIEALSQEIADAVEAGDEERLAALKPEWDDAVAEYEALTGNSVSG